MKPAESGLRKMRVRVGFLLRMTAAEHAIIARIAARHRRSINAEIRAALDSWAVTFAQGGD